MSVPLMYVTHECVASSAHFDARVCGKMYV